MPLIGLSPPVRTIKAALHTAPKSLLTGTPFKSKIWPLKVTTINYTQCKRDFARNTRAHNEETCTRLRQVRKQGYCVIYMFSVSARTFKIWEIRQKWKRVTREDKIRCGGNKRLWKGNPCKMKVYATSSHSFDILISCRKCRGTGST